MIVLLKEKDAVDRLHEVEAWLPHVILFHVAGPDVGDLYLYRTPDNCWWRIAVGTPADPARSTQLAIELINKAFPDLAEGGAMH